MQKRCKTVLVVTMMVCSLVLGNLTMPSLEAAGAPSLKTKKLAIQKGKSKTIKIKGKRIKSKKFKSSKKKIATVTKKGKVKGKKVGSCKIKITVKYRKKKKAKKLSTKKLTCKIKVVNKTPVQTRQPNLKLSAAFTEQVMNTSINLMKESTATDIKAGKNVFVSPESILTAMAMAVNGAKGDTQTEMQKALYGTLSVDDFNNNMSVYNDFLVLTKDVKFNLANSIWIKDKKDQITANQNFIAQNEKLYHSQSYFEPFSKATVKKMNDWVNSKTNGMIPNIIQDIPANARMYLMNALSFEGRWNSQYRDSQVGQGNFTTAAGQNQNVTMLSSMEHKYLHDDNAIGVMKDYEGSEFAFVAILPNKEISVPKYVSEMTGESFLNLIRTAESKQVKTKIPEFSYDYDVKLKDSLKTMGIQKAFSSSAADFGNMGTTKEGILYIDEVLHKTHIELDRNGTKAAAVTKIIAAGSAAPTEPPKEVCLDRPFLFAIVEQSIGLPIFMGVVNAVK